MGKEIVSIKVVKPGSNPDIDSDFNTQCRDKVVEYVSDLYGDQNVSNITTFQSLAAKGAFKAMCTIYNIPFAQANKIASLVPDPIEGEDCTLSDIFDPNSSRYDEGAEFRAATSESQWDEIIESAKAIEGRYRSSGLHACGILISSKPLDDTIPVLRHEGTGRLVSQWTYPECESLGLIKFDFLGLDTVDLIQRTVEYIQRSGKNVPNMRELIHGDLDDKETYELIARGDTIGIFQLGSDLVRNYLKVMKPTNFEDIVSTTALMRPGPMGMASHTKYAQRKNGIEKVESLHPDFKGSELDTILEETYGLVVFQEQVMRIANKIAGMTLQEGDELRKAMGKKKIEKMLKMKPKFFDGAMNNGFSEEAVQVLWDTIEPFSKYAFNRAHSVAYALTAYQAAYLKAHYPVEFMAALLSQNVGNKDKILTFLKETKKMGISVGTVDMNASEVDIVPDFLNKSHYDIIYGLKGINSISAKTAEVIVKEREDNGPYISVHNCVKRLVPLGLSNKRHYEKLAMAGAFDCFGVSRRSVVESVEMMLSESKTTEKLGTSLFDAFDDSESVQETVDLSVIPEYSHIDKLKKESDMIGLYLSGHPLSNIQGGIRGVDSTTIEKLLSSSRGTYNLVGVVSSIEKKTLRNGSKSLKIVVDDGTGYVEASVNKKVIRAIDKHVARERILAFFKNDEKRIDPDIVSKATMENVTPITDIQLGRVYVMNVSFSPGDQNRSSRCVVNSLEPIELDYNGKMPIRVRVSLDLFNESSAAALKKRIKTFFSKISDKIPGDCAVHAAVLPRGDMMTIDDDNGYYQWLADTINTRSESEKKASVSSGDLFGSSKKKDRKKIQYDVPSLFDYAKEKGIKPIMKTEEDIARAVDYFDTGFTIAKNTRVEKLLSDRFGAERVDFGYFIEMDDF